jgi:hypothetical protein
MAVSKGGSPEREVFTAKPAVRCERHSDLEKYPLGSMRYNSCPCPLADSGCYMIHWHGYGLGLVCDNEEDGKRKAYMMNVAWELAKEDKS